MMKNRSSLAENLLHAPVAQLAVQLALNQCGCGFESHRVYNETAVQG